MEVVEKEVETAWSDTPAPACLRLFLPLLLLFSLAASAQRTRIYGHVIDAETREPLAFAQALFQGTNIGADADSTGRFYLETGRDVDSLVVTMFGYHTETLAVSDGVTEELDIELFSSTKELAEARIVAVREPAAWRILRKVIANKPDNRPERLSAYEYNVYHRVRFDLNQFTEKAKRNLLLRPFDYIWDYADTTADGVNYLPILLTESSEEHFYRSDPPARKDIVHGRRTVKFFRAPRISEFVEDMYIDPDIYDNYVVILEHAFPSPINDHYRRNYDHTLHDSIYSIDGFNCHRIDFKPKGRSDVAFAGTMYIHDSTFAVVQVDLTFSIEANINFVRNYWLRYNYQRVEDRQWFLRKSQVLADFTVVENSKEMTGFFGRKTSEVRGIVMDQPRGDDFYAGVDPVVMDAKAFERDSTWWEQARATPLTAEEKDVEEMVGRMNSDPKWRRLVDASKVIGEGWLPARKLDIGNVWTFYSYNAVEGHRAKLGLRTTDRLSKRYDLVGHVAYGFRDERWKGGLEARYHFLPSDSSTTRMSRRWTVGARYRNDLVQQGRTPYMIALDHVLTSFIRIAGDERRMLVEESEGWLERQWFTGFSSRAGVYQSRMTPLGYDFRRTNVAGDTLALGDVRSAGVKLTLRLAWGARELPADLNDANRRLFFLKYPMVTFEFQSGMKGFLEGDYDHQRYTLRLEHQLRANKWGYLNIIAEGGMLQGQVPYPLLHTPGGNPLLLNDDHAFNLMNYLEFVSDEHVSLMLEHHFEGFFLNKVPLLRRLKLREFIIGKAFYGTLRTENRTGPYLLSKGSGALTTPYYEFGFGIENILKLARVDFIWRTDHLGAPDVLPFIVKPSFYLRF